MEMTTIIIKEKIKPKNPILVEGLPGIGLVGKIAVDHMIKALGAKKIAEVYSPHFPHQVVMQKNGVMRMLKNRIYYVKGRKNDLLILVGDVQAVTSEAQYEVCGKILDYFEKNGGKTIITLGGYASGKAPTKPRVFGSASHKALVEPYTKYGIVFGQSRGSIIGAAGLLLGLGKLRGLTGVCLMGETHGAYVDPHSAKAVLEILSKMLEIKIDTAELDARAKKDKEFYKKMEAKAAAGQGQIEGAAPLPKNDLSYIR